MFPVLTTDSLLSTLGLGTLSDAISCEVEEERNGSYELTLEYPQGGVHADDIAMNTLIVAKPNFTDDPQPFRIYSITKDISGKIVAHAQHISYDLGGVVVSPTTMTGATCKQAGDYLVSGTSFTFKTDKTNSADFTVDVPSSARSWFGGKSGSLMGVYGTGEYHYDGYEVEFNLHRGTNRGVELRYGKNLTELTSEMDCTNLASSVVCFYEDNGTVISGTAVSTGLVGITRELAIDVSDDYDTPPSVATLTARATQYITDHNLTAPKTNITLDFVQASKLKDRVDLCDTVSIYYEALGVSAVTKCIRTVWDVLAERYTETEFGDAKTNIADTIVEVEKAASEAVSKTTMQQAIDSATEQITGNNGGFVVFHDSNNDGFPDEILIMDTADISTAVKIWRANSSGLGYSSTGYAGPYGLAITQQGEIVADYITAGTLSANVIKAGILQDAANKNSWNMTTGALTITDGSINITTQSSTFDAITLTYGAQSIQINPSMSHYVGPTEEAWWSDMGFYMQSVIGNGSLSNLQKSGLFLYTEDANGKYERAQFWNNGDLHLIDASGNARLSAYSSTGGIWLKKAVDANTSVFILDTDDKTRTRLSSDALTFFDANGAQTAIYPADPSTFLKDNDITASMMEGSGYNVYSSTGTTTISLTNDKTYLVTLTRRNSTDQSYNAVWLVSAGTSNSSVTTIKSGTGSSASVSGLTLSITRGTAYSRVTWLRLN